MAQRNSDGAKKSRMEMGQRMFSTRNSLEEEVRRQMVDLLNPVLAAAFDLFSQTKQAHWNVKGRDFYQLHELYDELAETLLGFVDMIAERATALGGVALGTVRMAAQSSQLEEYPVDAFADLRTVEVLAERYAAFGQTVREGIDTADEAGDQDTADLLTEVSREVDKALWFLEAHLQEQSGR